MFLNLSLQDEGGWLNEEIVEKFKQYADFCFKQFGDRVKLWITLNEPKVHAVLGHGRGHHAPGIFGRYMCVVIRNLITDGSSYSNLSFADAI